MQPLSILCRSFRDIDTYTMGFPRGDGHGHANIFRAVKQCLPGPVRNSHHSCLVYFSTLIWCVPWKLVMLRCNGWVITVFAISKLFFISINMDCILPSQYTFILTASKELPKQCVGYGTASVKYASRKNVGVRISDDAVCQAILQEMDSPLICTRSNFFLIPSLQ